MMSNNEKFSTEFKPKFHRSFLHPRYWLTWLGIAILLLVAYIPVGWRNPLLAKIGRKIGGLAKGARRRARINLLYCFPTISDAEREKLLDKMFETAVQTALLLIELRIKDPEYFKRKVKWHGKEHLQAAINSDRNVILFVPHAWGVDLPGMLLAEQGHKVAAMFHHQKNPVIDFLWNNARLHFGGRAHAREKGIKPFISSVREGYLGYYLPDQDHGIEQSEFVDFFATYKATLPVLGRLIKVCQADVIPVFPVYNAKDEQLEIHVRPAMKNVPNELPAQLARRMNEEIEILVKPNLEQYAWILKLLKTRKNGEIEPYARKDL